MTDTKPDTITDSSVGQWPPQAHLIRPEDRPAKEGTRALCGAKLMGIDLEHAKDVCMECRKIAEQELTR